MALRGRCLASRLRLRSMIYRHCGEYLSGIGLGRVVVVFEASYASHSSFRRRFVMNRVTWFERDWGEKAGYYSLIRLGETSGLSLYYYLNRVCASVFSLLASVKFK